MLKETIEGILLKVDGNIINVATETSVGPQGIFRYTHSSTFMPSCQGKVHTFETEGTPRGLCRLLSYKCNH